MRTNPIAVLAGLERRAQAMPGSLPPDRPADSGAVPYIGYRSGRTRIASLMHQVREILPYPELSLVPGTRSWLKGLSHLRGRLLCVVDLRDYLGGGAAPPGRARRVLVTEHAGLSIGLLVEEVYGIKYRPEPGPSDPGGAGPSSAPSLETPPDRLPDRTLDPEADRVPPARPEGGDAGDGPEQADRWLDGRIQERATLDGATWHVLDLHRLLEDPEMFKVQR